MPLFVTKLPQFLADLDRLTAQDFGQKVGDGINQSQLIEGATLVGPEQTTAPCQNLLKDDLTEKNVRHPLRVGMQLKSDGIHSIGMIPRFACQGDCLNLRLHQTGETSVLMKVAVNVSSFAVLWWFGL